MLTPTPQSPSLRSSSISHPSPSLFRTPSLPKPSALGSCCCRQSSLSPRRECLHARHSEQCMHVTMMNACMHAQPALGVCTTATSARTPSKMATCFVSKQRPGSPWSLSICFKRSLSSCFLRNCAMMASRSRSGMTGTAAGSGFCVQARCQGWSVLCHAQWARMQTDCGPLHHTSLCTGNGRCCVSRMRSTKWSFSLHARHSMRRSLSKLASYPRLNKVSKRDRDCAGS